MAPSRIIVVTALALLSFTAGLAAGPPRTALSPDRTVSTGRVPSARPSPVHSLRIAGGSVGRSEPARRGPAFGTYAWPVQGPVIRGFEEPASPYDPGHRGIDIAAPFGTQLVAAQDGVVAFAGPVAGSLFISIDHPDGVRTTYSWLSQILVKKGDQVARSQVIGRTGHGHPDVARTHLHFGARVGRTYIDPMLLLEPGAVAGLIHLAPLMEGGPRPR